MNKKISVLYIKPDFSNASFKSRFIYNNFFTGQEGYFEEALFSVFDVTNVDFYEFQKKQLWNAKKFDVLVVNYKIADKYKINERDNMLINAAQKVKDIPKVLFIPSARAEDIPDNKVFDVYDLVFKREHFKDLDRYNLSEKNKQKLHTTMLSCLFLPHPRNSFAKLLMPFIKPLSIPYREDKQYDIFFSGVRVRRNNIRAQVLQKLLREGFKIYGGLQATPDAPKPPRELLFPRLSKKEYAKAMRNAKINLALDGIGEFTFRHLEIWYLGEFMISSPSIKDLALPLPVKEDVHYVSYNSLEELVEKVRFYLHNEDSRRKIALAGKRMFDKYYNPYQHGIEIRQIIEKLL